MGRVDRWGLRVSIRAWRHDTWARDGLVRSQAAPATIRAVLPVCQLGHHVLIVTSVGTCWPCIPIGASRGLVRAPQLIPLSSGGSAFEPSFVCPDVDLFRRRVLVRLRLSDWGRLPRRNLIRAAPVDLSIRRARCPTSINFSQDKYRNRRTALRVCLVSPASNIDCPPCGVSRGR